MTLIHLCILILNVMLVITSAEVSENLVLSHEGKQFYRTSRQSDFWYPGQPRDNFGNAFERHRPPPFENPRGEFGRPGFDPFRNPIRDNPSWQNNFRPGINNPGTQQGTRRQFDNNVLNSFNIYDYMIDRTTTERPELTTIAVPGQGTTISPCEQACPTTMQFDPICGDNGFTYSNMARFRCAIGCGRRVRILHVGACPRK